MMSAEDSGGDDDGDDDDSDDDADDGWCEAGLMATARMPNGRVLMMDDEE